jgi:hypothetical protein
MVHSGAAKALTEAESHGLLLLLVRDLASSLGRIGHR